MKKNILSISLIALGLALIIYSLGGGWSDVMSFITNTSNDPHLRTENYLHMPTTYLLGMPLLGAIVMCLGVYLSGYRITIQSKS